jgi:hypothetical protein
MSLTSVHVMPTRSSTRRAPSFKSSKENWQTTLHSLFNCRFPQPLERTNFGFIENRPRNVRRRHQSFSVDDNLPTPHWNNFSEQRLVGHWKRRLLRTSTGRRGGDNKHQRYKPQTTSSRLYRHYLCLMTTGC